MRETECSKRSNCLLTFVLFFCQCCQSLTNLPQAANQLFFFSKQKCQATWSWIHRRVENVLNRWWKTTVGGRAASLFFIVSSLCACTPKPRWVLVSAVSPSHSVFRGIYRMHESPSTVSEGEMWDESWTACEPWSAGDVSMQPANNRFPRLWKFTPIICVLVVFSIRELEMICVVVVVVCRCIETLWSSKETKSHLQLGVETFCVEAKLLLHSGSIYINVLVTTPTRTSCILSFLSPCFMC